MTIKIKRFLFNFFLLIAFSITAKAAIPDTTEEYYSPFALRYEDYIYQPSIHTIILSSDPSSLGETLMKKGSEDRLFLGFDDLDGDFKSYQYTVIHCTYDWKPSNLSVSDYIEGFQEQPILDYRYSRNTLQKFTYYSTSFPNENFRLLLSGNYILKVYRDNDPDKLVFTRRFMIFEEDVIVTGTVHAATNVGDRNFKQEVDFRINYTGNDIANPFTELKPVIRQNGRWDNMVMNIQPQFVNGNELIYDYDDINVFLGGSEFRWFDTRSLRYQSERVQRMAMEDGLKHVYLLPDEKRTYKRYVTAQDINGRFMIKTYDGGDSTVEADYVYVHFFLPWEPPITEGNLYVFGSFCDWQCRPETKMVYNYERRGYEAKLFLKQGYYNYEYVLQRDNTKIADNFFIEGMHQETENAYVVYVYQRRPGQRYDRLVGLKRLSSRPQ